MNMESKDEASRGDGKRPCYRDINLQILFIITIMTPLTVVAITPAFPRIVQELNISPQEVGLLISVFTFPGIITTIGFGVLADRFGRKKILFATLMISGIAGTTCAFVRDFNSLLLLRFLQGIGAGPLLSLSVTVIGDLYSGDECAKAMGYNVSALDIGLTIFPFIGGAIAMLGWYYPFIIQFITIPVGILLLFYLKNPEIKDGQSIKEYLKNAWQIIKNRRIIGLFFDSAITFMIFFGIYMTYLPLLIGISFGASPIVIGSIMSFIPLVSAFTSSQVGKLARRSSEKNLIKAAFILYALALSIIPFVSNIWLLLIPAVIFGIAHGTNEPSIHALLSSSASIKHRAALMSVNWTVVRLGQTLGPLLMAATFVMWDISAVFYSGVVLSIIMFLLAMIMIK